MLLTLRALFGIESKMCFPDFCSGRWGRRTTSTSSRFLLFFLMRPKAIYVELLHNTTPKDIILKIINSVK